MERLFRRVKRVSPGELIYYARQHRAPLLRDYHQLKRPWRSPQPTIQCFDLKKKRGTPKTHRQHISLLSFRSGSCQQEYRLPACAGGWESHSFDYLQTGYISKLRRVLYLWDDHSTRIPPAIIRIGKTDEAKISIKMDDETKL